jgi:hypothetical protein
VHEVSNHAKIVRNRDEPHRKVAIKTPTDLAECHVIFKTQFKTIFNVKTFAKILKFLSLTENLSHIPRVQKPGLRPTALAFPYPRPGQKPAQAKGQGPAWLGLAWPGFWPQAKAGTSLLLRVLWLLRVLSIGPTSLKRGEGLVAGWLGVVEGEMVKVVVERWVEDERISTVMRLMWSLNSALLHRLRLI